VRLGNRGAQIAFAVATIALVLACSIGVPDLIGLILTVLYLVLLGYLIECGLLPPTYWPFGQIDVFALAVYAACLVAALACAMGLLIAGAHREVMIALAVIVIVLLCGGMFFLVKGTFYGHRG
jgi:hypothetical protein